ncbi:MAG: PepSY domain-containing protein [Gammaproteobacteria bacterium]|nr:PepSY domain-containing protein [Gammaproteobacteria bacterium]
MFATFRQAMAWLHTWFGLVLGFVLMAAFFFGALSVFDREFDRWAIPHTRFAPQPMPSFDTVLRPALERMQPAPEAVAAMRPRVDGPLPQRFDTVAYWSAYTTHRGPVVALFAGFEVPSAKHAGEQIHAEATVDPRDGHVLPDDRLRIGSGFFYPMHYGLTLEWKNLGVFIVGFSALAMLAALVSGVVMHRKLFRELFTFRPGKQRLRSVLDLHNLTGVVALPFHFFFALTGVLIFAATYYFPVGHTQLHALHDHAAAQEARQTGLPHQRAGVPAGLADVDAMVADARARWEAAGKAGDVGFLLLMHPGDANGYVSVYRAGTDRIALVGDGVHYDAATGALLREDPPPGAVGRTAEFLAGLHLQHFRHWLLRWLYVFGGLAGAACIATGFLFFVEKRKRQHAALGLQGARVVDALAVAAVTGMVLSTLGILDAHRVLPEDLAGRDDWEKRAFWATWLLALLHAGWRSAPVARGLPNPAWREQAWAIAALALAAPLLNWLTTGDHLLQTVSMRAWPVAGVDLALLAVSGIAALAARRLGRPGRVAARAGLGLRHA